MNKLILTTGVAFIITMSIAQKQNENVILKNEIDSVSYLLGVNIGNSLSKEMSEANFDLIVQGFRDAIAKGRLVCQDSTDVILSMYFQRKAMLKQAEEQFNEVKKASNNPLVQNIAEKNRTQGRMEGCQSCLPISSNSSITVACDNKNEIFKYQKNDVDTFFKWILGLDISSCNLIEGEKFSSLNQNFSSSRVIYQLNSNKEEQKKLITFTWNKSTLNDLRKTLQDFCQEFEKDSLESDFYKLSLVRSLFTQFFDDWVKTEKNICSENTGKLSDPSQNNSYNNKVAGEKFMVENAKKPGVKTTASGLQYQIVKEGKGGNPSATSRVKVHYHGTNIYGEVFDSSLDRGEPVKYRLDQVIPGWTEGLQLMKKGAIYRFFIPQELAYGPASISKEITPYSCLIFEVQLLGFTK